MHTNGLSFLIGEEQSEKCPKSEVFFLPGGSLLGGPLLGGPLSVAFLMGSLTTNLSPFFHAPGF